MSAFVFVGPTLAREELPADPDIVVLPPVAQGDLYRAAQRRPHAIGIIDGYFEGVPAVWHKEILWAMDRGIHVLGAASMGALRAAELHAFGMRGIGRIFEAYRDGLFEDDDEVAVLHGPAEAGYVALSEAMASIRATLEAASGGGIIAPETAGRLTGLAKGRFYQERTWQALLADGARHGLPGAELAALEAWLPQGRIDRKREDARALIDEIRTMLAGERRPLETDFDFAWTVMWDDAVQGSSGAQVDAHTWLDDARILDELRLEPDTFSAVRDRALLRLLATREGGRRRREPALAERREVLATLRTRHGLFTRAQLEQWLDANDLDGEGLERLVAEDAALAGVVTRAASELGPWLLDELRYRGTYAALAERAARKQSLLADHGLADARPEDAGIAPPQLLAWFFENRLGQPVPDDVEAAARQLGYEGRTELYRALLRERLYCVHSEDAG